MDDEIPRTDDLAPRDIRCQISGLLAQLSGSLANDFDVSLDGGLEPDLSWPRRPPAIRSEPHAIIGNRDGLPAHQQSFNLAYSGVHL